MYSPRISEVLIPHLYRWAKSKGVPMTTLVNQILSKEIQKHKRKEKGNERINDSSGREQIHHEGRA